MADLGPLPALVRIPGGLSLGRLWAGVRPYVVGDLGGDRCWADTVLHSRRLPRRSHSDRRASVLIRRLVADPEIHGLLSMRRQLMQDLLEVSAAVAGSKARGFWVAKRYDETYIGRR